MAAIRFRSGSDFSAVYERHHQALYRYCRSILRHDEDAQDALQSTMTRALAALREDERDLELRPWLFRIAHNEAITILRKRRATAELEDTPAAGALEDRVLEREELRALALDLADLPERQRAALLLRELNGLSHAEIGSVLDLSVGAVKTAIFEARTAVSSCREGRELPCTEIRRALSDGDGRTLRARGIRAHLRGCRDCCTFRDEIGHRPRKLALLPGGALLVQLLGGTAAKVVTCVVIASASTTLAVEMRDARAGKVAEAAAAPAATPNPHKAKKKPTPARTPAPTIVASAPAPVVARPVAATLPARPQPHTAKPRPAKRAHAPKAHGPRAHAAKAHAARARAAKRAHARLARHAHARARALAARAHRGRAARVRARALAARARALAARAHRVRAARVRARALAARAHVRRRHAGNGRAGRAHAAKVRAVKRAFAARGHAARPPSKGGLSPFKHAAGHGRGAAAPKRHFRAGPPRGRGRHR